MQGLAGGIKGLQPPQHNLPAQMTSLLGRSQEIAALSRMLHSTDKRLLTLTGPGGSGKTRLALAVATELLPFFKDGVFWVSLAALREPELVLSSIAQALHVEEVVGQSLATQLGDALQDRSLLLVLDNFEHVLAAGPLVAEILLRAPHVKVLATSREILHLYGEHECEVLPLPLPDRSSQPSIETITQSAAVALFVERAQAVKPAFVLTHENMGTIAEICIRLDGLPLAIELAAARMKLLHPLQILLRLEDRFKLLTGSALNVPMRQRTLRNTLDWSYDLLNANEKRFFRRLGVLMGTWTLCAAGSIGMQGSEDEIVLLDMLTSLVDKSLVRAVEETGDGTRFMMLETIREYALECLGSSGEQEVMRRLHAQFYVHSVEEAGLYLHGREQQVWLQRLDREAANLWGALRWMIESKEALLGLRMTGALIGYFQARSTLSEGRNWLEEVLLLDDTVLPTILRARVLYGAGVLAWMRNDLMLAHTRLEESRAQAIAPGALRTQALASGMLAQLELHQGNYEAARHYAEEGAHLSEEAGDRWCKGLLHSIYGKIESKQGNFEQARVRYHVSLVLLREAGDLRNQADVMTYLASSMRLQGRLKTAHFLYTKSLLLFQEVDDRWNQAMCINGIGEIQRLQGAYLDAQAQFEAGLALATSLGNKQERAVALTGLGQLAMYRGDLVQAA